MNWQVLFLSSTVNAENVKKTRGNIEYQKNYFNTQKKLQYSVLSQKKKKKNGLIYRVMIYNFNLISLLLLWIIFIQVISFLSPSFPFLSPPFPLVVPAMMEKQMAFISFINTGQL